MDLIAEAKQEGQRWRKRIPDDVPLVIGRDAGAWSVAWDARISRKHARLTRQQGRLLVEQLPEAKNPVFFQGVELARFYVSPGQHFVIGQTSFTVVESTARVTQEVPRPIQQRNFTLQFLEQIHYRNAQERMAALSQLPQLVTDAANETQLYDSLSRVLLNGVTRAQTVAIVSVWPDDARVEVVHWDCRFEMEGPFQPSQTLILEAIASGQLVLHVWSTHPGTSSRYTIQQRSDWAFVCPLKGAASGGARIRQAIYISGDYEHLSERVIEQELQDEMKFVQLVGTTYANLVELNQLQQRQAGLRSFFSPIVLDAIAAEDPDEILKPRECLVSVLFCDLRGFSAVSETMSSNLLELLKGVSDSLGIMTSCIMEHKGVVGDFHGDAVMGFWGWPLDQPDAAVRACQTALHIAQRFDDIRAAKDEPIGEFLTGLGIASGRAVAGKIGSADQVKVTAFGPVVNLAARLESLTRQFRVPILLDEASAQKVIKQSDPGFRLRKLAFIRPAGIPRVV
ncbi:MAG TPA: adenylate/guanylate cyclase domain-containing protein, partial [Pirellulaceae bacterium]|nr:adenylate/guanylate cyclase domain-containing protein [Pirellulaceae bacterium]